MIVQEADQYLEWRGGLVQKKEAEERRQRMKEEVRGPGWGSKRRQGAGERCKRKGPPLPLPSSSPLALHQPPQDSQAFARCGMDSGSPLTFAPPLALPKIAFTSTSSGIPDDRPLHANFLLYSTPLHLPCPCLPASHAPPRLSDRPAVCTPRPGQRLRKRCHEAHTLTSTVFPFHVPALPCPPFLRQTNRSLAMTWTAVTKVR